MFRLLIIDDEPYIVSSLQRLFTVDDRYAFPDLDVHTALSAQEALDFMDRHRVDIVLTDIRLPDRLGLDLLQEIHALWPRSKVIFLTAYDEFEFAQRAIREGGFDYLLKTEDNNTIVNAVRLAMADLAEAWEQDRILRHANQAIQQVKPLLQQQLCLALIGDPFMGASELRCKFREYGMALDEERPVVLTIGRIDTWGKYETGSDRDLMLYAVQNIAADHYSSLTLCPIVVDSTTFVWFSQGAGRLAANEESWGRYVQTSLDAVQSTCRRLLDVPLSFVTGESAVAWHHIREHYAELRLQLHWGLGRRGEAIVVGSGVRETTEIKSGPITDWMMKLPKLELLLEGGRYEEFAAMMDEWVQLLPAMTQAKYLESYYNLLGMLLRQANNAAGADNLSLMSASFATGHDHYPSRDEAAWALLGAANNLFERGASGVKRRESELVSQIQQYAEENLEKELTLTDLADFVHLNADYLSRIYKSSTGEGLHEYLTRLKINRAKQLLHETDLKIQDIACKVGIASNQYFSRFFKKHTRLTPQEYRDRAKLM